LFNFVQALVQFCSITIVGQDGEFVQFVQSACSMFKMSGLYGLWGSHLFVTCLTALLQPGHLSPDGLNKRAEQAETRDPNTRRRLLNKAFEQNLNKG
jgi:hypothetical protein